MAAHLFDIARTRPLHATGSRTRTASGARRVRGAIGVAVLLSALLHAKGAAGADLPAPLGPATSSPTPDDTRFGAIGHLAPEEGGVPSPSFGASATQVGHVTWAGLRADVPVSRASSIVPQAALLRVSPYGPDDTVTYNAYVGGGVGLRPSPSVGLELSALYGPRANQLASFGLALATSLELVRASEADEIAGLPPRVVLDIALAGSRFDWANGRGPAGSDVLQAYLQAQLAVRLGERLLLTPKGMYFLYDRSLDGATGDRLGSVSALARVGSYAPRWMAGGRVTWQLVRWLAPFVEAEQIGYAEGIGHATKLDAGARARFGRAASFALYGGAIVNSVGGPLVPPDFDLRTVPLVALELELRW
jgi:hypothetical protein